MLCAVQGLMCVEDSHIYPRCVDKQKQNDISGLQVERNNNNDDNQTVVTDTLKNGRVMDSNTRKNRTQRIGQLDQT